MRAVGYIRVSTPGQAKTGESLEVQKENINNFVKLKGWELHHIYADEGISGKKSENRPALQQLLHDAEEKFFDAVIVSDLTRFGRNARDINNNIYLLGQLEITFISIKESIDLSNPFGVFIKNIFAAFAELESEMIRERMLGGKLFKWRENRMFNGKPPYGYRWNRESKMIEVNEDEKAVYLKIVDLYLNHGMGFKDIGIYLMKEGIIGKNKPFNSSTISYLLKNSAYYGHLSLNQHKYKDGKRTKEKKDVSEHISFPIPPFISKTMWDEIQRKTQYNIKKGKRITISENHWLRDMIYCGECGGRMRSRFGSKRKDGSAPSYYSCHWSQTSKKDLLASGKEKCSLPHISTKKLEDQIWNRILFHLTVRRNKYFTEHFANQNYDKLVAAKTKACEKILNAIAQQNRVKEHLYKLLEEQSFNKSEFISKLNSVKEKILELEQSYKDRQNEIQEAKEMAEKIKKISMLNDESRGQIHADLEKLSFEDRKRLAENMFEKISVFRDQRNSDGFKVKYHKYGPVTVLEQFIRDGKLPSFGLDGLHHTSQAYFF